VVAQGADHVTLRTVDNIETRDSYPFQFVLDVSFGLSPAGMEVSALVRNAGGGFMPYAFGLHPGFRWPLSGEDKAGHRILFDAEERAEVPVIAPGGLIGAARRPVPLKGRELALDDKLFDKEALCFLDAASHGLTYAGPQGQLRVELDNFPHIVLWSRPGAPFLCLESWTGHGDPEGFAGDLFEKPGMIHLEPGLTRHHGARYSFTP
jgi:galactose mutarotase-like enzyme